MHSKWRRSRGASFEGLSSRRSFFSSSRGISLSIMCSCEPKKPNKAPEPTTTAVTPRAFMSGVFGLVTGARGAPAVVVAHL